MNLKVENYIISHYDNYGILWQLNSDYPEKIVVKHALNKPFPKYV